MNDQTPRKTGGWLGGFILFATVVALAFLAQIPAVGAVLQWISTTILALVLLAYLAGAVALSLIGFGHWFGRNPLTAFLKLIFWPFYGLLLLFQKAN